MDRTTSLIAAAFQAATTYAASLNYAESAADIGRRARQYYAEMDLMYRELRSKPPAPAMPPEDVD